MITESSLLDRKVLKDGHTFDQSLLWMVVLMTAFSILMIYSASIVSATSNGGNALHYAVRQMIFVGIGTGCAVGASFIPMAKWQRMTPWIMGLSLVGLVLVLIVGRKINGATRWIELGPFNVQPAEIYKLAVILYLSSFFVRRAEILVNLRRMIIPGVFIGLGLGLVYAERDLGSTVVVACISLGLLFLAGLPLTWFLTMLGISGTTMVAAIALEPYRMKRLEVFMNPWEDPFGDGYQIINSLVAIGRGEWLGSGLGTSVGKYFLPEAHTDFILAIISEEFGFMGMMALIFCYAWLVWRALTIGKQARDLELFFGAFVAQGIAIWLGIQSCFNIAVNIDAIPTKGLTLPLMSYGGSSVIVMLVCMALLLRVDYENRLKMRGFHVDVEVQKKR